MINKYPIIFFRSWGCTLEKQTLKERENEFFDHGFQLIHESDGSDFNDIKSSPIYDGCCFRETFGENISDPESLNDKARLYVAEQYHRS